MYGYGYQTLTTIYNLKRLCTGKTKHHSLCQRTLSRWQIYPEFAGNLLPVRLQTLRVHFLRVVARCQLLSEIEHKCHSMFMFNGE